MIDAATRNLVRQRAGNRCEYCDLPQDLSPLATLQVEHVRPRKHGGTDDPDNLALACIDCNLHKGPNAAGYDPETGTLTELFNTRRQVWSEHFRRADVFIIGTPPEGRTTVVVLELNSEDRLELRSVLGSDE